MNSNRVPTQGPSRTFYEITLTRLRFAVGTGRPVDVPVSFLRWTHDKIHAQMVFMSGRYEGSSIYELVHNLLAGIEDVASVEPLDVVLDGGRLYSLSNRRLAAVKMFQALRQHDDIRVPCLIYEAGDACIASRYKAAKTTSAKLGDGTGVLLHGTKEAACHLGKPLFRCAQEWCDAVPPAAFTAVRDAVGSLPAADASRVRRAPVRGMSPPPKPGVAQSTASSSCQLSHDKTTQFASREPLGETLASEPSINVSMHGHSPTAIVSFSSKEGRDTLVAACRGEVEIHGVRLQLAPCVDPRTKAEVPTAVFVKWDSKAEGADFISNAELAKFFAAKQLEVSQPSSVQYSMIKKGMEVEVMSHGTYYRGKVVTVSPMAKRVAAPVKIHYIGYNSDSGEWVGAARLRLNQLEAAVPVLASSAQSKVDVGLLSSGVAREPRAEALVQQVVVVRRGVTFAVVSLPSQPVRDAVLSECGDASAINRAPVLMKPTLTLAVAWKCRRTSSSSGAT